MNLIARGSVEDFRLPPSFLSLRHLPIPIIPNGWFAWNCIDLHILDGDDLFMSSFDEMIYKYAEVSSQTNLDS